MFSFNSLENETLVDSDGTMIQICDWIDEYSNHSNDDKIHSLSLENDCYW